MIRDASGFDATMNPLSYFLQPAARKGPRYSVRPFYATILIFTTLVIFGWVLNIAGGGQDGQIHQRTAAGVSLVKRDESEVRYQQLRPRAMRWKLIDTLCDLEYSVA